MPRTYRRKRFYTTPQRILVHLSPQGHPTPPGPDAFTQDGIAAGIRSGRSTVTKWLARLEGRGLLARDRGYLDGYLLPKMVYRLTPAGMREAERLLSKLSKDIIEVQTPSLGTLRVRAAELPRLAPPTLDLTDSVSLVHGGRLDLARHGVSQARIEPVVWGEGLRRVDRLFGRDWEIRSLDGWAGSPARVLLVTGLAGIGKSALVAAWLEHREPKSHVFGVELRRTTRVRAFLAELAEFLTRLGRRELSSHLAQEGAPDFPFVGRLLSKELRSLPVLVVLDNADHAAPDVARFVRRHLLGLTGTTPTRFILLARRAPKWIVQSSASGMALQVLQLHGLDLESSLGILRYQGFRADESKTRILAQSTRGHPLLLHLVAQGGGSNHPAALNYLEEEVWNKLTGSDRRTLQVAAVFRRAVPPRLLQVAAGVRGSVVRGLLARNLLESTVAGRNLIHDVLRDFVIGHTAQKQLQTIHEKAARALLAEPDQRDRWEGVYHLLEAGKTVQAAAFLDSSGAPLLDSVAAEDIASLVRGIPLDHVSPKVACVFSEALADCLRVLGHISPALYEYAYAKRMAESSAETDRVPRLLRKMAFIERCRARFPRALGYLVEAHARLADAKDRGELVEVLREMALVEQGMGKLAQAAVHFNEAIDLATERSDLASLSRALLALGSLETQRGHRENGLEYNLEGLRIAERSGNLTEVARGHIVVGTGLVELRRFDEGLTHYERGLEVARLLGNLRLSAYATLNRAGALIDLGRFREAGPVIREAQGHFGVLEEKDTLGLLKIYEGAWEKGMGQWQRADRAWQEGIAALRESGSPVDLVRSLRDVGRFHAEGGDTIRARNLLLEARTMAHNLGNATLLSEIEGLISGLMSPVAAKPGD